MFDQLGLADRTALLVIDPFNDFLSEGGKVWPYAREVAEAIGLNRNLEQVIDACRRTGILVVYVPHRHYEDGDFSGWRFVTSPQRAIAERRIFEKDSWGAAYRDGLEPTEGDPVATPHWTFSGFAGTDLDVLLRQHGRERLLIVGMRANACVESTARFAVELGYHVTVVTDAVGALGWEAWRATCEVNMPELVHRTLTTAELVEGLSGEAGMLRRAS